MSSAESLARAVSAHQSGNLAAAEQIYRQVLAENPNHPDALHLLGVIAHQTGHSSDAIPLIQKAIHLLPTCAAFHNNLGEALRAIGQLEESEKSYRQALQLDGSYLDAKNNLGIVLQKQGKLAEAKGHYIDVLKADPKHASAHLNIGSLHQELGNHAAAIAAYAKALEIEPSLAEAHNNLGTIAQNEGRLADAMHHYNAAVKAGPSYADAYYNRGNILKLTHRLDHAAADFHRALQLHPDFTLAAGRLADVYQEQGETKEARNILQVRSGQSWLLRFRAEILCPPVFGSIDELKAYREQLRETLDQQIAERPTASLGDLLHSGCEPPFALQFHGRCERSTREQFASLFRSAYDWNAVPRAKRQQGPIRIGFVVTDFHELAFAKSMTGILNRFSQDFAVEILCAQAGQSLLAKRLTHRHTAIKPLPNDPLARPKMIAEGGYDLLYYWEVGTDSQNYFLPYFRLAPVQLTSWGIQLTTGIPTMDYYLSSRLIEVPGAQAHYTEKLILGETLLTCQPPTPPAGEDWHSPSAKKRWREKFGFPAGEPVYACPHQLGKFHPDFDRLLFEILETDLSANLVITGDKSAKVTALLADRLNRSLGAAAGRVTYLPRLVGKDYFGLLAAADVLLDPILFGGVNTTYDAMAMAKPIVTWPSEFQRGRMTLGCYRKMGVSDLIADSADDYVRIAVQLGTDPEYREALTRQLGERSQVLFEDAAAAKETERILLELAQAGRSSQ